MASFEEIALPFRGMYFDIFNKTLRCICQQYCPLHDGYDMKEKNLFNLDGIGNFE